MTRMTSLPLADYGRILKYNMVGNHVTFRPIVGGWRRGTHSFTDGKSVLTVGTNLIRRPLSWKKEQVVCSVATTIDVMMPGRCYTP